jgi:hypothetical protein
MFLDVFWVLYPQNEEDSSQTYSVTGIADHYAISSSSSYLSDRQTTTPKITRFAWNDSDRFGVALCRTYEATQPRLRRQWAGLPATSPSGTAGRETVVLSGWMWLYSPVNVSKAVSQTTHMDWILIPPIKIGNLFLANIVNFPIAV